MKIIAGLMSCWLVMPVQAADVQAGKAKAALCAACHGNNGIAVIDTYPNLAGQNAAYLELSLRAYRDGSRRNPLMSPVARGLSEQDIADLAAYFASLPAGNR